MSRRGNVLRQPIWLIRLFFFVWLGGTGFILPFLQIFYWERGISGLGMGILSAVGYLVGMVSALWIGQRMENSPQPIRWLQISLLLNIGTTLLLGNQTMFLCMLPVVALNGLVNAVQSPIAGAFSLRAMKDSGAGFGSIRVWASLGWSIFALIAGFWIQRSGIQIAFYGFGGMLFWAWLITLLWRNPPRKPVAAPSAVETTEAGWGWLFRGPALVFFLLALVIALAAMAGVRQFENVYLKQLGAGEQLIGAAATLSALVELPGMFFSDWQVRRYGARKVLAASFIVEGSLRALVLFSPSIAMVLAVRTVTGVSFSMTTTATMEYIQEYIPIQRQARAVSFYTVAIVNLVYLVVCPLSGLLFDAVGAYWLYALAGAGNLLGALCLIPASRRPVAALPADVPA